MAGQSITFDFLSRGAASLSRDFRSIGDDSALSSRGVQVLSDVISKLGDKEDRTAAESKLLASALRQTGDAADRAAAKAVLADAAIRRLGDSMQDSSKKSDGLNKALGGLHMNPGLAGPALALIPALGTLTGVVAAAGIGLSGAFIAGGGALAAFGAIAKPVLTDAKTAAAAVEKAQNNYSVAIANGTKQSVAYKAEQIAIGKAYASLSPQQIALSKQIGQMASAWDDLKARLTPVVAGALQPWLKSVTDLTKNLAPIIAAVSPVIKALGGQFDALVNSAAFKGFRDFVAGTGSKVVGAVGGTIIDLVKSLMILLPKFNPLILQMTGGIAAIGPAVLKWASSQKTADQITAFMGWFTKNGPVVGGLLTNLGLALKALAPGLTTGGALELKVISDFFGLVAKLPASFAKPITEVAGALLILSKMGVLKVGVQLVGTAVKWLTGGLIFIGGGDAAAAAMRAAFTTGGAAAAAEIRGALAGGGAAAGAGGAAAGAGAKGAGGVVAGASLTTVVGIAAVAGAVIGEAISKITTGKFESLDQWKTKWVANLKAAVGAAVDAWHSITQGFDAGSHAIEAAWNKTFAVFADFRHRTAVIFDGIRGAIAAPFIAEFDKIRNFITTSFDKWWAANGDAIKAIWRSIWQGVSSVFHSLWDPLAAAAKTIWTAITGSFSGGSSQVRSVWQSLWTAVTSIFRTAWDAVAPIVKTGWALIQAAFNIGVAAIKAIWNTGWAVIQAIVRTAWAAIQLIVKTAWDVIVGVFTVAINLLTGRWGAAWNAMKNLLTQVWNNIKTFLGTALSAMGSAVSTALNQIVGFFSALGSRILGALGKLGGLLVQSGKDVIQGLLNGMTSIVGNVWTFIKGIPGKILSFLGIKSPPQWAIDAGKHIMNGIGIGMTQAQGALAKATAAIATSLSAAGGSQVANVGSGVSRWTATVLQALKMEGLSSGLLPQILRQISSESGGNPNAINNSDINAQQGDPSRGLLQTIGSTFAAYHWPGTSSNIYDPLANIAAAINYARHVYGPTLMSGGNGLGSGHGYAYGTMNALPGMAWVGERGPELVRFRGGEQVIPAGHGGGGDMISELRALRAELRQLTGVAAAIPAATGRHVGGAISGAAGAAAYRNRYPQGGS